jgi:hypothetical protein
MSDRKPDPAPTEPPFDGTFEGTRRRQILAGLQLDPAARLRWLEERMDELRRFQGAANRKP